MNKTINVYYLLVKVSHCGMQCLHAAHVWHLCITVADPGIADGGYDLCWGNAKELWNGERHTPADYRVWGTVVSVGLGQRPGLKRVFHI